MIYTEYQQVLLTQLQNNDKRIEEIKKEKEEIQEMFLQESKFKPGDLIQIDYKITKVSHPLKHQLFSFSFVCLPPYPLTVNTCLTEVMQTIHILRPIFPTLQPLQGFCSSLCRFR